VKPALGNTIRGKKNDNVWKNHLKGLGIFTNLHMKIKEKLMNTNEHIQENNENTLNTKKS